MDWDVMDVGWVWSVGRQDRLGIEEYKPVMWKEVAGSSMGAWVDRSLGLGAGRRPDQVCGKSDL
jgi:hypothetical protein